MGEEKNVYPRLNIWNYRWDSWSISYGPLLEEITDWTNVPSVNMMLFLFNYTVLVPFVAKVAHFSILSVCSVDLYVEHFV